MRLQSDPTIIYGITLGKSKLDRPLTRDDIAAKTPYNTYQIDGLPPGPISNPGRDAIAATLQPAKTKDLYFVADGSGGHVFAETLDEHNKNVANWREIEKKRREAQGLAPLDDLTLPEESGSVSETQAPDGQPAAGTQQQDAAVDQPGQQAGDAPAQVPPEQTASTGIAGDDAATDLSSVPPPGQATEPSAAENQAKAVPNPKPKPGKQAAAEPVEAGEAVQAGEAAEIKEANLKPGSVIRVGKRLLAIPMPKPQSH
jgi:UPF0755 protein